MRKLGIIALDSERPPFDKKWYQFWKRRDDYELLHLGEFETDVAIVYLPIPPEKANTVSQRKLDKWTGQLEAFFQSESILNIIPSKKVRESLAERLQFNHAQMHNGRELFCKLTPQIIHKMAKNTGTDSRNSVLAYIDDTLDFNAQRNLRNLTKRCKYISVITKNEHMGRKIARDILEEFGLPIDVFITPPPFVKSDYAILGNADIPKLSSSCVIIDLGESEISSAIRWAEIEMPDGKQYNKLPIEVNSLEMGGALCAVGAINERAVSRLVINRLYPRVPY